MTSYPFKCLLVQQLHENCPFKHYCVWVQLSTNWFIHYFANVSYHIHSYCFGALSLTEITWDLGIICNFIHYFLGMYLLMHALTSVAVKPMAYLMVKSHYLIQCLLIISKIIRSDACFSGNVPAYYQLCNYMLQLDESMARRHLKSPQSLSGRSLHLPLVTKWPRSHMTFKIQILIQGHGQGQTHWSYLRPRVQINMFAFRFVAIGPVLVEIYKNSYFTLKIQGQGHSQGQIWWSHLRPRVYWCVCFSFCGTRTIFGTDIANSIFDLENSRSRSCPRSNPMVTFEVLRSIDMFAFRFVAIGPFLTDI